MKSQKEMRQELNKLSGISVDTEYYRFVSIEFINDLLSSVGSFQRGGRYNLPETFEVLYMAPDPHTAITETTKDLNFRLPPQIVVTIDVTIQNILDLKDQNNLETLGIEEDKLFDPWRIPRNTESYTQRLGRLVYESRRFEGIHYPSARVKDEYNLAIFPDRLRKKSIIRVYDPKKIVEQIIEGKI